MARKGKWRKSSDVDQYIRELEECYGMRVEMEIDPKASAIPGQAICTLKAFWADCPIEDVSPCCFGRYEIAQWPLERYMSTMLHACVEFTYQCIEAHIQVLPQVDVRLN